MSYIKFENINKYFGKNHVLKDISLEIEKGHLVTLLGPSGCGKSTLLRCLAGLEEVSSGKVYLDGKDITNVNPRERGIGMVFQQYSLFPNLSVAQNVAFGLKMKKMAQSDIDRKVKQILEIVGLSEKINQYPAQLSGGQQQRVALARAIVTEPKVLLLDEPLSAIDAMLRRNLQIEIRRIQKDFNMTTIFVTHDQDEAMVMSDVVNLFNAGNIEQSGTPIELYTQPKTRFAASFIGSYNILPAADFGKACGETPPCTDVAIRPEIVRISRQPNPDAGRYNLQGQVVSSISHGHIIRYTVWCHGCTLNADVMFDVNNLFDENEQVHLSIRKSNVIEL